MRIFSIILALSLNLMATVAYVMEENNKITPTSFNQTGISFMQDFLDQYVKTADINNIKKGMAQILRVIKQEGIDNLIKNQDALKEANITYNNLMNESKNCAELFSIFYCTINNRVYWLQHSAAETPDNKDIGENIAAMKSLLLAMGYFEQVRQNNLNQTGNNS